MIYVMCYSMRGPETSSGLSSIVSGLFENAFNNGDEAMKYYKSMPLSDEYPRKQLWAIEADGRRVMLKEDRIV